MTLKLILALRLEIKMNILLIIVYKKKKIIQFGIDGDNYNQVQENELFVYEPFLLFFEINEENKVKYEYYE